MSTALDLAQRYFTLSNQGDLASIETMFAEDATYSSDNTGVYFGRADIMQMMTPFFAAYSELHWQVESAVEKTPYIVEMEFRFQGKDQQGVPVERRGLETLVIAQGKIRHIEVRNR